MNEPVGVNYIHSIAFYVSCHGIQYHNDVAKECNFIINRLLNQLRDDPQMYLNMSEFDLDNILKITVDNKQKAELIVGWCTPRAIKVKAALDDALRILNEVKAEFTPDTTELQKQRAVAAIMDSVKHYTSLAQNIIKKLSPLTAANPPAADMIKSLKDALAKLDNLI